MQAEEGKRVTLRFICRLEDGTLYDAAESDRLEFVMGSGEIFPALEKGIRGMRLGEHRTIRVSRGEVGRLAIRQKARAERRFPASAGYEFAPGDEGDVVPAAPFRTRPASPPLQAGAVLVLDVELTGITEAED